MKESLTTDYSAFGELSSIEKEILVQYQQLAVKLYKLSDEIAGLNKKSSSEGSVPADALLGNMRNLERKIGLVYTLFKTAVYSMQIQNQELQESERQESGQPQELHSEEE